MKEQRAKKSLRHSWKTLAQISRLALWDWKRDGQIENNKIKTGFSVQKQICVYEETSYIIEKTMPITGERIGYSINGARITMTCMKKKRISTPFHTH